MIKRYKALKRVNKKRKAKRDAGRDPVRVQHLHDLGCIVCLRTTGTWVACTIHHTRQGMGMGMRNDDAHAIGLCPDHHQEGGHGITIHAGQETFEAIFGTETELLAATNDYFVARGWPV